MSLKIQEDPTRSTSGLTSATQTIDITNEIRDSYENTTSAYEQIINVEILEPTLSELEIERKQEIERQKFKEAMKRSLTKDINILKELSKY